MPRAGWIKPVSERWLSDLVSVGLLIRTFPPGLVDEAIAGCGRTEQRHRSLPARVMAYFSIGMALHSEGSYEDVLSLLTEPPRVRWRPHTLLASQPSSSSVSRSFDALLSAEGQPKGGPLWVTPIAAPYWGLLHIVSFDKRQRESDAKPIGKHKKLAMVRPEAHDEVRRN
jgi:hypothetical protein